MYVALSLLLFSCTSVPAPTDPVEGYAYVSVRANGAVAAAEVRVTYDANDIAFERVSFGQSNLLARAFDDGGGTLTLGFVSTDGVSGTVFEVEFVDLAGMRGAVDVSAEAYDEEGRPLSNAIELEEVTRETERRDTTYDIAAAADQIQGQWEAGTTSAVNPELLEPAFADYKLGDASGDGVLDVLDVLRVLYVASGRNLSPTAFELYHSDLGNDGDVDVQDVLKVLGKAVDPSIPASLHVAPSRVGYEHVLADRPILIGNAGSQPFASVSVGSSEDMSTTKMTSVGVDGHAAAYSISIASSWKFGSVSVSAGAAGSTSVRVGSFVFLIAGQSNAAGVGQPLTNPEQAADGVRMLGNDYVWKQAYEPLDDPDGQLDSVSLDTYIFHSFGVRLGNDIRAATGRTTYLIPSARGGSRIGNWLPSSGRLDRSTTFGSANYRAHTSAGWVSNAYGAEGGPVTALVWYQGESDRYDIRRDQFVADTDTVMDAFVDELRSPVIIYVQLASHNDAGSNDNMQIIREYQRLMETGAQIDTGSGSPQPRPEFHMVVAHDLPRSDEIHLSAAGQRMLGSRIALAIREHALGEAVNGTGPRLVSITQPSSTTIKVKTTRTINDHSTYDGYFSVDEVVMDGGSELRQDVPITSIGKDPLDGTAVLISLSRAISGTPSVKYAPPSGLSQGQSYPNVVQDSDGLPLPAFGTHGAS